MLLGACMTPYIFFPGRCYVPDDFKYCGSRPLAFLTTPNHIEMKAFFIALRQLCRSLYGTSEASVVFRRLTEMF